MEAELKALLKQTVQVASTTLNTYGEQIEGTPTSYPARTEYKYKMVRDSQGREVVSKAQTYLDGDAKISASSIITLPDGTKPLILDIEKTPDETGEIHHIVVYT